ncbi:MAG: YidC/Oxa1 family membrane protein insertase [Oscillospiraceae bacterium]|nr:YidC/Oxa1 family membrane protein insertase [Oscillospiraceae bacterium]MBP5238997.1 YidC/Oxa1 family membrane protein insertase [Oscillospiraceae bacterium]MBP5743475.1 YidC/Oxa1 family membrane protein insertase [Oscillospiraceae bacterium]
MWKTITKPFAWLMIWLYNLTGSYGWAIILFALAVNLVLAPFMAKSKKSMMRSTRLQPKIQELQRRHEGNQQKLNAEMQKLYREEGVNPMSGCLWSLIPFPILIALYSVIRMPMTRMMFVADDFVTTLQNFFVEKGLYTIPERADAYMEIKLTKLAHENWDLVQSGLAGKIDPRFLDIDFSFLGLNLGDQPRWNFFANTDWSDVHVWLPALGLFLIPFISAFLSWLSMKISTATNPPVAQDSQAAATTKSMNLMMPLMSIWICFVMPAAMGIYWIANSVFGIARDYILTKVFKKQLDIEDAERKAARDAREWEIERQHEETERLRAEGKTEKNVNTSKKKIQANEKQKNDERKAALERAERAERRERLGVKEAEKPASQVGNRRYARGRAYVPDRFTNPENAEEATAAAALASEDGASIDETVEEAELIAEALGEAVETAEAAAESADE